MKKHVLCVLLCLTVAGCSTLRKDPVDVIEQEIEDIEERKVRELATELQIPYHYLRAVNVKGANEGWVGKATP